MKTDRRPGRGGWKDQSWPLSVKGSLQQGGQKEQFLRRDAKAQRKESRCVHGLRPPRAFAWAFNFCHNQSPYNGQSLFDFRNMKLIPQLAVALFILFGALSL